MKTQHVLVTALVIGIVTTTLVAQNPSDMDRHHREMMSLHAKLTEQQKVQDAEIDKLIAEMNTATGEKRVDAVIAVVNKLVEQRRAMQAEMASHFDK